MKCNNGISENEKNKSLSRHYRIIAVFSKHVHRTIRDGPFGKYSNYPDGRITEVCIHQVGYLMTDTGHLIVAVDKDSRPLICRDTQNEKTKTNCAKSLSKVTKTL